MTILPLAVGDATTTGAGGAISIATLALPNLYFGMLRFTLTGEKAGAPDQTFSWECEALYSCDAGVATMRSQGVPIVLNPDAYAWVVTLDQTGASARITVTGIAGQNWVWSAVISNVGRTRLPLGTTSYIDASVNASVTADFVYTGANMLPPGGVSPADGNMEWATANPPWSPYQATLTKEAGAGVGGTQCLKVVETIAGAGAATQHLVVTDIRCNFSHWILGGVDSAAVYFGNTPLTPYTAVPGAWTNYTGTNKFALGELYQLIVAAAVGSWSKFDDCSLIRLPIASAVADQIIGGPGVAQATAANRPTYIDAGDYFLFDGSSQRFVGPSVNATAGTVFAWVKPDLLTGFCMPFGARQALTNEDCLMYYNGAGNWTAGIGSASADTGVASSTNWTFVALSWDETTAYWTVNGTTTAMARTGNLPVRALAVGCYNNNATYQWYFPGWIATFGVASRRFTATELLDLYNGTYRV